MLLVIAGMHRSASTLAYQMGCAIVENEDSPRIIKNLPRGVENRKDWYVVKTHRYQPDMLPGIESGKATAIITIRDPRDVVVSMMNLNNESFDLAIRRTGFGVEQQELWAENSDNLHVFRYENFYNNLSILIYGIANAVDIQVDKDKVSEIAERFSFENNKARSKEITKTESDFMFPRHTQDGIVGKWKVYLDDKQARQVENLVGIEWLEKYGYD